ncbi:MAG TPA: oxygenase MpaB family protein [Noviherbaspirillum sp.]|uniref:oxygenase MpaB family protein n=1 Tax=Noviherbaspirillum sp. TaxID=1926288 RepID=UPI002DDD756F|nr:oxygenase MpaB family protein [Noviherbaspirillum sp.]HEV2609027.1 oxygenase MpaB family protein [Noviherbaspirillum sp.]
MPSSSAILLPSPLQRRLEAAASDFLDPGAGAGIDFAAPPGEPALLPHDSVSWRLFKNPLSLFIGGVAAVILELAEPRVRTGVWEHTSFRDDPLRRLKRTGLAAMMTVYGPRSRTEAMIAGVVRLHGRVRGSTPAGQPYSADDPELLDWVHATASFGFLQAYHTYVRPLSEDARDAYYREGKTTSLLYGALGPPASERELDLLFEATAGRLERSAIVFEFLRIMQRVALLPGPMSMLQDWLIKAAVGLVPLWARDRLELGNAWDLRPWQRTIIERAGSTVDRIVLRSGPAVQSCRRLGLPDDYLYDASWNTTDEARSNGN